MSLWPTMCRGSSCGGLPSAGTIQPRCCPYGCRADPLGAAVHIFDAAAPHHPVFARANPGAPAVLPHVPVLPPPTAGVTLRRVGQLLVRKNRALQSQEDAQSTLKVIGLDGHVPLPCSGLRGAKMERVSEVLQLPVIV